MVSQLVHWVIISLYDDTLRDAQNALANIEPIIYHFDYFKLGDLGVRETWSIDDIETSRDADRLGSWSIPERHVDHFIRGDGLRNTFQLILGYTQILVYAQCLYELSGLSEHQWTVCCQCDGTNAFRLTALFPEPVGPITLSYPGELVFGCRDFLI